MNQNGNYNHDHVCQNNNTYVILLSGRRTLTNRATVTARATVVPLVNWLSYNLSMLDNIQPETKL